MEIKTFHGFEDFCVEKFENTDEWYYGIYPTWMSNVEVAEECGKGREYAGSKLCFFNKTLIDRQQKVCYYKWRVRHHFVVKRMDSLMHM